MISRQCNCNDGTHPPPYEDQQSKEWKCDDETPGSDNNARAKRKRKTYFRDRRERMGVEVVLTFGQRILIVLSI